jgi:hypothetical protein
LYQVIEQACAAIGNIYREYISNNDKNKNIFFFQLLHIFVFLIFFVSGDGAGLCSHGEHLQEEPDQPFAHRHGWRVRDAAVGPINVATGAHSVASGACYWECRDACA